MTSLPKKLLSTRMSLLSIAFAMTSCGSESSRTKNGGTSAGNYEAGSSSSSSSSTNESEASEDTHNQEEATSGEESVGINGNSLECTEDSQIKISNNYGFTASCKRLIIYSGNTFSVDITSPNKGIENAQVHISWHGPDSPDTNRNYLDTDKQADGKSYGAVYYTNKEKWIVTTESSRLKFIKVPTAEDRTYEIEFEFDQHYVSDLADKQSFSGKISDK